MRFIFQSIRTKATILFFVLFILILVPLFFTLFSKIQVVLQEASKNEMLREADRIMQVVKFDPLIVPVTPNYELMLRFAGPVSQTVIFSSADFPTLPLANDWLSYYSTDTMEIVNVSKPSTTINGTIILSLARSNVSLKNALWKLKLYILTATAISVLIAALLVYVASGWMLKPIIRIADAASRITAAQSIDRVPVPHTQDESRILAEALNAMLARIERTIKNQTAFFASATHELKTPLAVMKAELTSNSNEVKNESLLFELERLDRVISDFLLISQLKSDSLTIRKTLQPVEEILYRALRKISLLQQQFNAEVKVMLDESSPDFVASLDPDKMETVLVNLFENAIRHSSPYSVEVTITNSDSGLTIIVKNPLTADIPDPSQFLGEFKKSNELSDGLGMGLWICDQITRLHNGKFSVTVDGFHFKAVVNLPPSQIPRSVYEPETVEHKS